MSAAHDYFTEVYNALLGALTNRAEFKQIVKAGNIVTEKTAYPGKPPNANVTDFPSAWLKHGVGSDDLYGGTPTFGTFDDTFQTTDEWTERITQEYTLLLLGQDQKANTVNQMLAEALTAFRKLGPRLGLSYPRLQKIIWKHEKTNRLPECGNAERHIITVSLPVVMDFEGNTDLIS